MHPEAMCGACEGSHGEKEVKKNLVARKNTPAANSDNLCPTSPTQLPNRQAGSLSSGNCAAVNEYFDSGVGALVFWK